MDSERAKQIYDEIGKYSITLVRDPGSLGPQYLLDLICTCRNYMNAVSRFLLEVHQERHTLTSALTAEEAAYGVESADLLANDRSVRNLPNIEDRKATISVLLRDRSRRINELKAEILNLDFVDKAVKHRHKELRDTMAEIRTQRSLIRDEIDTTAFYGDETREIRGKGDASKGSVLGIGDDELEDLFASAGQEHKQAQTPETPPPAPSEPPPPAKSAAGEPTNTLCPVCKGPQFHCLGGVTCPEGHGFGDVSEGREPTAVTQCRETPEPEFPAPVLTRGEPVLEDLDLEQINEFLASPIVAPSKKSDDDLDLESILANV
jgi:hypothetical protein